MNELRILVIDDDHFSLRLITEHLSRQGYVHVTCVLRAAEALVLLHGADRPPDIILCDLNMPDVDGIQFIEALGKTMWDGSLVLLTGENSRLLDAGTQLARTLGIQVAGTLGKPIDPQILRALLDDYEPRSYPYVDSLRNDDCYTVGELADAIEGGQLILHYQPQVRLSDGVATSIECLVRWRHPEDGLVYPEHLIPLAEEHELIDMLTERVVRMAMDQTRTWRERGLHLPVAINLSMNTLQREDVVEWLMGMLDDGGQRPQDVIWEVTETKFMRSLHRTLSNLTRLSLKKCGLSIDDFGTGHSSLAQLRDLPFTELKIDRSFVHNGDGDPVRRAIVSASAALARSLKMNCIAEGVETIADWAFVQELGCTHAQGWAIARPMPAISIPSWLERWSGEFPRLLAQTEGR